MRNRFFKFFLAIGIVLTTLIILYSYIHLNYFYTINYFGNLTILGSLILPFILVVLVVSIFVNSYSDLFLNASNGKRYKNGFKVTIAFLFTIPFVLLQMYLPNGFQKLHQLSNCSELGDYRKIRFLKFEEISVDTTKISVDFDLRVEGKGVMLYDYSYVAAPIISDDTSLIFIVFHEDYIKMSLNDPSDFRTMKIYNFEEKIRDESLVGKSFEYEYLEHINEDLNINHFKFMKSRNENYRNVVLLKVHKEKFENRNGYLLFWIILSYLIALIVLISYVIYLDKNGNADDIDPLVPIVVEPFR